MAEPVRVGIAGYGLAGRVFHGRLLAGTPGAAVTAVVTRDPGRRAQAVQDHPGAVVYEEVEAAIRAVDLLVVATPNGSHAAVAAAAVDAGVPAVVDKPLAVTAADARAVVERAEAAGVPLTVFQNRRWDADQLTLRRLVAAGELGEVRRYESRFERWRPAVDARKWRESLTAAEGGGILLDLGSHLVDQAVHLFGPVRSVYAEIDARRGGPEDDVFLALQHAGGVYSQLWASAVAAAPGPRLRVLGSAAAFVVEHLDGQEDALRAGRIPGRDGPWRVEPPDRQGELRYGSESRPVAGEPGRWDTFYPAVLAAVRDGGPVPVDPHDAVAVLDLLEAARRAAAERSAVRVHPSAAP
jgi:scyllo-inositol 2-dehydrogenase (NADP+)